MRMLFAIKMTHFDARQGEQWWEEGLVSAKGQGSANRCSRRSDGYGAGDEKEIGASACHRNL